MVPARAKGKKRCCVEDLVQRTPKFNRHIGRAKCVVLFVVVFGVVLVLVVSLSRTCCLVVRCELGCRSRGDRGRGSCWLFECAADDVTFHSIPIRAVFRRADELREVDIPYLKLWRAFDVNSEERILMVHQQERMKARRPGRITMAISKRSSFPAQMQDHFTSSGERSERNTLFNLSCIQRVFLFAKQGGTVAQVLWP